MPSTLHLDASDPHDISRAADLLRAGRLVAFATETVYGLGANALSVQAVAGIFAAKQRPSWDPLIVHLASAEQLGSVARVPDELAERIQALSAAFWPGPLTLLLPRGKDIPDAVTAGRELVGVRVPAHPAAQALLRAAGLPIAAPSANLFGHTSPTTAAHVLADLDGRIDAVLDAGPASIGLESTVLDPTATPMVLYRPGAITAEQLTAATGVAVQVFARDAVFGGDATSPLDHPASLPSPGVGIRHYAPRARMRLVEGSEADLRRALQQARRNSADEPDAADELDAADEPHAANGSVGVLLPTGWSISGDAIVHPWSSWDDSKALAATLFSGLRALDDRGVSLILCPLPEPGGLRDAIRDRLQKAARPA